MMRKKVKTPTKPTIISTCRDGCILPGGIAILAEDDSAIDIQILTKRVSLLEQRLSRLEQSKRPPSSEGVAAAIREELSQMKENPRRLEF